jgi:putative OPT family oligopeptide transporter
VFGFFFVAVTSRIVGIIGNSSCPVSGMTIATLLVCTLILRWAGYDAANGKVMALVIGAIVCIAISNAGDTSQDLKTGFLVGATPSRQQIGEMIGVLSSAFFVGLTIFFLHQAYGLGSKQLPAAQATLMSLVIPGLLEGNLPWDLVFIGAGAALVVELLGVSSLPFAIGLYLPIATSTPIMIGGILHWLMVERRAKQTGAMATTDGTLFASGLIAGDALVGVLLALVLYCGQTLPFQKALDFGQAGTAIAFTLLVFLLARVDWRRQSAK